MFSDFPHGLRDFRLCADSGELAHAVARDCVDFLGWETAGRSVDEPVEVGISGGFTSSTLLPAFLDYGDDVDWSRVRFWWVDERFVPADHEDRNDREAISSVLSVLPGARWVSMPADCGQGLEVAAADFDAVWRELVPSRSLDLALLGVGPDGHVASLFPGDEWTRAGRSCPDVLAVDDSPKPPPQRLTLSMSTLLGSEWIIVATAGAAKAQAIAAFASGADSAVNPVSAFAVNADSAAHTSLYVDQTAASHLNL